MKNCTSLWREAHFEVKMSKCTKHQGFGPLLEVQMSKKCTPVARSTFLGPLLEVAMSKKCMPLWREAHFEVKMLKTLGVRTTFGGSDVASLRFSTLHYITLHSTTVHYTTLHYTTLQRQLHNYTPLYSTTLNYTTLHYSTPHSTTLHYTTLHYTTLPSTALHYIALHYTTTTTTTTPVHQIHTPVHQWLRSAIPDSQQPTSPIGFLVLKLPPPPCAVLLVYYAFSYILFIQMCYISYTLQDGNPIKIKL